MRCARDRLLVDSGRQQGGYNRSMRRVYMDNNATSPLLPEALEAMRPYLGERFGNASSIHHHGQQTRAAVERARESVAKLLNCRAADIVFTHARTRGAHVAALWIGR